MKGQAISIDFVISFSIFLVCLIALIYVWYGVKDKMYAKSLESLSENTLSISSSLLDEGYPENWTSLNLTQIKKFGLLKDNYLNLSKVNKFCYWLNFDYNTVRFKIGCDMEFNISVPFYNISCGKVINESSYSNIFRVEKISICKKGSNVGFCKVYFTFAI